VPTRRTPAQNQQSKRERRLERQAQEAAARKRAARLRQLRTAAGVVVTAAAVAVLAYLALRSDPEVDGVVKPPDAGRGHVTGATYESATPTSGEHNAAAPSCGVTAEPLAADLAVHALEHGVVVVWYRADLDPALRSTAADLLAAWDSHWILSPNPGIDAPFVATAWNRLKPFDEPDESMAEFVETYRERAPEDVACPT
jgi:hypothetical protein